MKECVESTPRKYLSICFVVYVFMTHLLLPWPFCWFVDVSHKSRRNSLQKNEAKATLLSSTSNITTKSPPGKMVEWLGSFNTQSQPPQKLTSNRTETGERKGIPGDDNGLPSSRPLQESSWSPDGVTESPQGDLIKKRSHQTGRPRFNIITGCPLQLGSDPTHDHSKHTNSFTYSLDKANTDTKAASLSNATIGTHTEDSIEQVPQKKAPYLDMRQTGRNRFQKSNTFSGISQKPFGLSTYRASFQPAPGFYSSNMDSAVAASASPWDSSVAMKYSRHSMPDSMKSSKSASQSSFALPAAEDNSLLRYVL